MTALSRLPERWRRGERVTAAKLEQPGALVRELVQGIAAPQQRPRPLKGTVPEVRRLVVAAIAPDYLTCYAFDGLTTGDAPLYVARPPRLRGSEAARTFAGGTVSYSGVNATGTARTATLPDDSTESQVIVPEYVVGDELFAVRNLAGGTGVTRTAGGASHAVEWLDLNVDARAWAVAAE